MTEAQSRAYAEARIAFGDFPNVRLRTEGHTTRAYDEAKPWRWVNFDTGREQYGVFALCLWPQLRACDLTNMGARA